MLSLLKNAPSGSSWYCNFLRPAAQKRFLLLGGTINHRKTTNTTTYESSYTAFVSFAAGESRLKELLGKVGGLLNQERTWKLREQFWCKSWRATIFAF